jgi:hypothetical protein
MGWLSRLAKSAAPAVAAGGALGGTALLSAPQATAQDDTELKASQHRIAELENELSIFDAGSATEVQEALRRKGFPIKVDGKIGPESAGAIGQYRDQVKEELETARTRLAAAETHAAHEATQAGPMQEALREFAPIAAPLAGIALGLASRGGAVRKAATQAAKKVGEANALLSPGPVSRGGASPKGLMSRVGNINEFWRLGGAGERVPFAVKPSGDWRPRPGATSPSALFPEGSKTFRANDYGVMGSGLAEAGVSGGGWALAEAEMESAQAAVDQDPSEANFARLERARDLVALARVAMSVGGGVAAGRGIAAFKTPYASSRPNIAGAEAQRAMLLKHLRGAR